MKETARFTMIMRMFGTVAFLTALAVSAAYSDERSSGRGPLVVVDASGRVIGHYQSGGYDFFSFFPPGAPFSEAIRVVNGQAVSIVLEGRDGFFAPTQHALVFETSDCSGEAFVPQHDGFGTSPPPLASAQLVEQSSVFRQGDQTMAFFPLGNRFQKDMFSVRFYDGSCSGIEGAFGVSPMPLTVARAGRIDLTRFKPPFSVTTGSWSD